jgi:hypothetical protein
MALIVTAPVLPLEQQDEEAKANRGADELVRYDYPPNRRPSGSSQRISSSEYDRRRSKDETIS